MKNKTQIILIAIAILLLVRVLLSVERMGRIVRWNSWINTVYIVSQAGTDVRFVKAKLGAPYDIKKPREVLRDSWIPQMTSVPASEQVYIYECFGENVWRAYIFVDSTGHVVGSHIGSS